MSYPLHIRGLPDLSLPLHSLSGADTAELLVSARKFYHLQTNELSGFSAGNLTLQEMTRKIIEHSLAENNGNQSLTARKLGISRSTLWRILNESADAT